MELARFERKFRLEADLALPHRSMSIRMPDSRSQRGHRSADRRVTARLAQPIHRNVYPIEGRPRT
jgi:hypothetical protein